MIKEILTHRNVRTGVAIGVGLGLGVGGSLAIQAEEPQHQVETPWTDIVPLTGARLDAEDGGPVPCLAVGLSPDTIVRGQTTALVVSVDPGCKEGLVRIAAETYFPYLSVDGSRPVPGQKTTIELADNGQGQDKVAGDRIYTSGRIALVGDWKPPEPLASLSVIGKIRLTYEQGQTREFAPWVVLMILGDNVPLATPVKVSNEIQATEKIINLADDNLAVTRTIKVDPRFDFYGTISGLARKLYAASHGWDPYYFLSFTSRELAIMQASDPSRDTNWIGGGGFAVQQDFKGNGGGYSDTYKDFGSRGKLHAVIAVQYPENFDLVMHEFLHLWGAYATNDRLNLAEGAHWKYNSSIGGILVPIVPGVYWQKNADWASGEGTFTTRSATGRLAPLEKYLMCLISKEQVPPIYIASDLNQNFKAVGQIIHGPYDVKTIDDFITVYGPRIPGPEKCEKDFTIGYVLTTRGGLATREELTAREILLGQFGGFWQKATDYLSHLEARSPALIPKILSPETGSELEKFASTLRFNVPPGTKWLQVQLVPFNNDGPGIDEIIGDAKIIADGQLVISEQNLEKGPGILLPDETYTWRVRTSASIEKPDVSRDELWTPWAEAEFKTPKRNAQTIYPISPAGDQVIANLIPTLAWGDFKKDVFYYEIQLSKDPTFNTDPTTATAAVYGVLVHGGLSRPLNSWTLTSQYALEPGATYYWRIRPRIQGDGKPVDFSSAWSFKTSAGARVLDVDWDSAYRSHWEAVEQAIVANRRDQVTGASVAGVSDNQASSQSSGDPGQPPVGPLDSN